ncbi:MAG: ABC transporter ATP-binding protein [Candidatus Obscuribacterales bacterium]|nr:ABC transporter ATP-binding protein [Candidatus Obscuribacterales bacterium]
MSGGGDTPRLQATDLITGWRNRPVSQLNHVELSRGQCIVLAGPNGSGKSTILKTLTRQIKPIAGSIFLNGRPLDSWSSSEFASKVAYVPQAVEIYRRITVQEWVALGRNPHQQWWSWQSSAQDLQTVERALEKTGLGALREKFMDEISGGEQQRATIAMALAQEPQFLLLDEPSAHLDFRHQLDLVELLLQLREGGMGLLIVLHDLNLISRLATEIKFLKQGDNGIGSVACAGSPATVLNPEVLRTVYDVDVSILPDAASGLTGFLPTKAWP